MNKRKLAILVLAALSAMPIAAQVITSPGRVQVFRSGGVWMGVGVQDVTDENMKTLKLKEERGVEVVTVNEDSPASKAGLKEHDVVLEFNGSRIEGVEQFKRLISETPAGRTVKLVVSRDGVPITVNVKLEERTGTIRSRNGDSWVFNMPNIPTPPAPPAPPTTPPPGRAPRALMPWNGDMGRFFDGWSINGESPRLGIEGEEIGSQLSEFFGVPDKDKGGVLVRSVTSGSAAEKAGIKAGDVIVKVDNKRVQDMSDLREQVRDNAGKSFSVTVIRNKKEMTLTVKIERAENRRPADDV